MFRRLQNLRNYYELLGCDVEYKVNSVVCEICGTDKFTTICSHTDTGNNLLAPVPVKACNSCGFLMQNPRFPEEFYKRYYNEFYPYMRARSQSNKDGDPNNISGKKQMEKDGTPNDFGFEVAYQRAESLYSYMNKNKISLPQKAMLDVGCGCGGFLQFFADEGFYVVGNDPDIKAVTYGRSKGLHIDLIPGEEMDYPRKFGLIIIIGSLEHCFEPNIILEKCWNLLDDGGVLVIEGRYYPVSESFRWLNSNHHRFFTNSSSQSILLKHGFEIIKSTTDQVCGSNTGRNGSGFAFGRKDSNNPRFLDMENQNIQEDFLNLLSKKNIAIKPKKIIEDIRKHDKFFNVEFTM